jgi:hypothetical protein
VSVKEHYAYLPTAAQLDLEQLSYGTGLDIGAGLMGRIEGRKVAVDRIVENPCGPHEPDLTEIDFAAFSKLERVASSDEDEYKLVGSVHSHEEWEEAGPIASPEDLTHVRQAATRIPGQLAFAMLIVAPGAQYGGHQDWRTKQLRAWLAHRDGARNLGGPDRLRGRLVRRARGHRQVQTEKELEQWRGHVRAQPPRTTGSSSRSIHCGPDNRTGRPRSSTAATASAPATQSCSDSLATSPRTA